MADIPSNTVYFSSENYLAKDGNEYSIDENSELKANEEDAMKAELESYIVNVLNKSKYKNIFNLVYLDVGRYNNVGLAYSGPPAKLQAFMNSFVDDMNNPKTYPSVSTDDGYTVYPGQFTFGDTVIGDTIYTVNYDGGQVNIVMSQEATAAALITAFAEGVGYSKKDNTFLLYNEHNELIKGHQARLRKCCFSGIVSIKVHGKEKPAKASSGAKTPRYAVSSKQSHVDKARVTTGRSSSKNGAYTLKEIKAFLKERGLRQNGSKEELVERLLAAL